MLCAHGSKFLQKRFFLSPAQRPRLFSRPFVFGFLEIRSCLRVRREVFRILKSFSLKSAEVEHSDLLKRTVCMLEWRWSYRRLGLGVPICPSPSSALINGCLDSVRHSPRAVNVLSPSQDPTQDSTMHLALRHWAGTGSSSFLAVNDLDHFRERRSGSSQNALRFRIVFWFFSRRDGRVGFGTFSLHT